MKVLNATGHLISGLPKLLFQNEAKCEAIDMKMNFILMQINLITALCLVLKVRPFGVGNGLFESYLARFLRVPENKAGNRGTLQCIFFFKNIKHS